MTETLTSHQPTVVNSTLVSDFTTFADYLRQSKNSLWKKKSVAPVVVDEKELGKLLLNAWSAEYALRITSVVNDEQYLQSALHWSWPQSYYAIFFSARTLLLALGTRVSSEDRVRKLIAGLVSKDHYPSGLGFYASGSGTMQIKNTAHVSQQTSIAMRSFVVNTRRRQIKRQFAVHQANPKTALRYRDTGKVVDSLPKHEAAQMAKQIGYTTYFDLMSRLRISTTNREIEYIAGSDFDVLAFHKTLVYITQAISYVHQFYIWDAIGDEAFTRIVDSTPSYIRDSFLTERLNKTYKELLA